MAVTHVVDDGTVSGPPEFQVPVVDLSADAPGALTDALVDASCVFVVGHGVPSDLIAEMERVSREFFALPREVKAPTRWPGDGLWRGWQPVADSAAELTGDRVPDPLERFEIQLAGHPPDRDSFALWPSQPADFAGIWTAYYTALGSLASRLMTQIATSLALPAEQLAAWTDEHYANLVVNNYLAAYTPAAPDQQRLRAHTDRGGLTLLWADSSPGGLQVMLPANREWIPVQIPAEAFLVQAGDLLTRWTNRVIRPNIHRVGNAPAGTTADRISIPYFHYPRLDAVVAPAPSCLDRSSRPAPAPVVAGDHAFSRQEAYKDPHADDIEALLAGV